MIEDETGEGGGVQIHMGETRTAYRVLAGIPWGTKPLGRPLYNLQDNIKMDLREVLRGCVD
jgi:hypothetical protein